MNYTKLKKIDFYIQLVIFVIAILLTISGPHSYILKNLGVPIFDSYLLVGSYQLFSAIFWLIFTFRKNKISRFFYLFSVLLLAVVFTILILQNDDTILAFLLVLLFLTPLLALYYCVLTYNEWRTLENVIKTKN